MFYSEGSDLEGLNTTRTFCRCVCNTSLQYQKYFEWPPSYFSLLVQNTVIEVKYFSHIYYTNFQNAAVKNGNLILTPRRKISRPPTTLLLWQRIGPIVTLFIPSSTTVTLLYLKPNTQHYPHQSPPSDTILFFSFSS